MDRPTNDFATALERAPDAAPRVSPAFVLEQGAALHLVDLRDASEATGPLGYIPGSAFLPADRLEALVRADDAQPVVLVSGHGMRAGAAARRLVDHGAEQVAVLRGGLAAWRRAGFGTSRDPRGVRTEPLPAPRSPAAPTGAARRILTVDDVRTHIGDPRTVRWVQLASLLFQVHASCIDGRDARGIVGTPGGDAGEFVLGLAASEQVSGASLSETEIEQALVLHLDTCGDFYMHSDEDALSALAASLRDHPASGFATRGSSGRGAWHAFLNRPPDAVRDALLDQLVVPAHVGCGHLRRMLEHGEAYGVRTAVVEGTIRAFFRLLWAGAAEPRYEVLGGGHGEGAVVNVRLSEPPSPLGFVPVISPAFEGTQMFVNHPDVARVLRRTAVRLHCGPASPARLDPSRADELEATVHALADRQLAATVGALAKGLPVYDVVFEADGTFDIR